MRSCCKDPPTERVQRQVLRATEGPHLTMRPLCLNVCCWPKPHTPAGSKDTPTGQSLRTLQWWHLELAAKCWGSGAHQCSWRTKWQKRLSFLATSPTPKHYSFFFFSFNLFLKVCSTPNMRLELTTLTSRTTCSANRASQAPVFLFLNSRLMFKLSVIPRPTPFFFLFHLGTIFSEPGYKTLYLAIDHIVIVLWTLTTTT